MNVNRGEKNTSGVIEKLMEVGDTAHQIQSIKKVGFFNLSPFIHVFPSGVCSSNNGYGDGFYALVGDCERYKYIDTCTLSY